MEHRLAPDQTPHGAVADGGEGGGEAVRRYEFLFEMTTQLLAAQHLEEQISLILDAVTAGLGSAGRSVRLTAGLTVSTVQGNDAGLGSVPPAFLARTRKVCSVPVAAASPASPE